MVVPAHELATVLIDLAQQLAAELPAAVALSAILDGVARMVPYDRAAFLGIEDDRLVLLAAHGGVAPPDSSADSSADGGAGRRVPGGLIQAVVVGRRAQVFPVPEPAAPPLDTGAAQEGAWLGLPLIVGQRLVGLLCCEAPRGECYDETTASQVAPLAAYAALVVDRARLMQEVAAERSRRAAVEQELAQARAGRTQRLAEDGTTYAADLIAANDELARAARMKDEFLAAMSHELRTPLNTILGMTEVLLDQVFGVLNERQLRSLRHVGESGRHLLELINDILDVAKVESGQMQLHVDVVDLPALCSGSLELVRPAAEKKQISLTMELDPAVSHLYADGRRVRQILVNLLNNAVKFTPDGGQIGLCVTGDRANAAVNLVVWDTGIGIAAADLPRLFKPFVQIDSSLNRHYEGTGLGLIIVQRFSQLHGGSVAVESTKDAGSRFTVALPWVERELRLRGDSGVVRETAARPIYGSDAPGHLILVVDEYEPALHMLAADLAMLGYAVETARGGAEAIQKADQLQPSLVIMDTRLAGLDAVRTLRQIAQNSEHMSRRAAVPVIILTALAIPGERERCLAAGAAEFLVKPQGVRQLQAVLRRVLREPPPDAPAGHGTEGVSTAGRDHMVEAAEAASTPGIS